MDYVGELDLSPLVQAYGEALDADSSLSKCDNTEAAYCFTLATVLGRACEGATSSPEWEALSRDENVYFFVQQHDQEPQLFHVVGAVEM